MVKSVNQKCPECGTGMDIYPLKNFNDRTEYTCPQCETSVVRLIKKRYRRRFIGFKKRLNKSLRQNEIFNQALACYLEYFNQIEGLPCRKCLGFKKKICDGIGNFNFFMCSPKEPKKSKVKKGKSSDRRKKR